MYDYTSADWCVYAVAAERVLIYPSFADSDAIKKEKNFNDYRLFRAQAQRLSRLIDYQKP